MLTLEERCQVDDGALRVLRSSDFAPSTEGRHEDGDLRPSCDDLLCADLHVRLLRSGLVAVRFPLSQ